MSKLSQNSRVLGNFIELDTAGANPKYELFYNTGIRRREGLANNAVSVTYDKPDENLPREFSGVIHTVQFIIRRLTTTKAQDSMSTE